MDTDSKDHSYVDAASLATGKALGLTFAGVYLGMVEGGMAEDDAIAILSDYVVALGSKQYETE